VDGTKSGWDLNNKAVTGPILTLPEDGIAEFPSPSDAKMRLWSLQFARAFNGLLKFRKSKKESDEPGKLLK
jgi:hypothetical protein